MNTENHYQETDLGNISLNPRGEYSPEESYEYLDLVVFEGGSYVCLAENGATITGISPESGKTTQYWHINSIPGTLTPEYIAMHDRVVNLSEQVGADAEEVRTAEQNVSGMELNVTRMQEQTRQAAESAEQSKDSAAGYAASADASRQAAEESKQNINAQVTGFDSHVAEKTSEAESNIEAVRIAANAAVVAQQEQSVNEVARAGIEAISTARAAAQTATEKAQAADTSEKNAAASEVAAKLSEENATKMAEQVAADKEQVANDRTAVENAKQEMKGSVAQIEQNTQGISELKSDLDNFGDSFRKIKPDALSDSLRCELINIDNLRVGSPANEIGSSTMNQIIPTITWARSTQPIAVSANDVIIITIPANCVTSDSDYGMFLYDSNGTLLRIDRTQPYTVKKKITVQENERYIVINHYFSGTQWLSAKYTDNPFGYDSYELSGLKIACENVYGSVLPNQWVGKKCAAIGCSVTQMGVWTGVVKSYFKFSKMYNRGLGGTTLANFKPYNVSNYVEGTYVYSDESLYDEANNTVFYNESNPLSEDKKWVNGWYSSNGRINLLPTDADLVLIDMATNDFYRSLNKDYVTVDEFLRDSLINSQWTESQNPAVYDDKYFCDAFMLTIKRIMTRCPSARIVVWGMMYNGSLSTENGAMQYYRRMIDKIKYMCDVTGVYFIDTMSEMGVNLFNFTEYIDGSDGVHPQSTAKGGYAIASVLISHLRNLYPKDYFVN